MLCRKTRVLTVVILTISVVLFPGCIEFTENFTKFCDQEYQVYIQNSYLRYLDFNIPKDISRNGLLIKTAIYTPDGSLWGIYQRKYYYPVPDKVRFDLDYQVKLIYIGMWHIDFWIYEGMTTEDHCAAEGMFNIIVKEETDKVYFYHGNLTVPEQVYKGDDVTISFTVENTGTIDMYLPVCLWNATVYKNNSLNHYSYGSELFRTKGKGFLLRDGETISKTIVIQNVKHDFTVVLNYGEKQIVETIKCINIVHGQNNTMVAENNADNNGFETSLIIAFALLIVMMMFFYLIRRKQ